MDAGMINGVLFPDYICKAFDTFDHGILLSKLSIYGIQNKALIGLNLICITERNTAE
jgi:hypothetical protein